MTTADWIAVDWGTSNLRAFAMRAGQVISKARAATGMNSLGRDGFEPALLALIEPWLGAGRTPVVACGMVGARQGWIEANYVPVPCRPVGPSIRVPAQDPRLDVVILPGLSQANPPDVMRGEETQIAGFLALQPAFDGVVCLPGTHTKWVRVSAGEICHFRTVMTGEMFELLSSRSVLRHSLDEGWDGATFAEAVEETLARPERIGAELFSIRARGLLGPTAAGEGRARLSGLLIGAELAATRPYWLGQEVAVIGADALSATYAAALRLTGLTPTILDGSDMTLAGLTAAYHEVYA